MGWVIVCRQVNHLSMMQTLPVRQRIVYKLATLVYKCLFGRAPAYLAEYCRQAGTRHPGMRSAGTSMLDVPCTTTALCDSFHLPSPAHTSGTACQLTFVIRHCPWEHLQHC